MQGPLTNGQESARIGASFSHEGAKEHEKDCLREYARLIVRMSVNVQKGQDVVIYADLDQPEFVAMVVEEAYKAKAREVTVEWNYPALTKYHVRY